jgi:hypothetical protein
LARADRADQLAKELVHFGLRSACGELGKINI